MDQQPESAIAKPDHVANVIDLFVQGATPLHIQHYASEQSWPQPYAKAVVSKAMQDISDMGGLLVLQLQDIYRRASEGNDLSTMLKVIDRIEKYMPQDDDDA